MTERVPHWESLNRRIAALTGSAEDRAFKLDQLIEESKTIIIPEKHCEQILQTIEERVSFFNGGGCQMRGSLMLIQQNIEAQIAEYQDAIEPKAA